MHRLLLLLLLSLIAAGCGTAGSDDDDASGGDQAQTPADDPADDAPSEQAAGGGELPTLEIGWGIPGDEVKYVMIADPAQAPNLGSCYEVEWTQITSTALATQSLAAGTLDGGTVGALPAGRAIEQGADLLITGQYFSESSEAFSTTWMVRDDGEITTAEDVAGATVGTSGIGNPTNFIQEAWLEDQAGLVAGEDYEVVEVPYPQELEALASGNTDVGIFAQPFYGQAAATGELEKLFTAADVKDPFVQLIDAVRREVAEAEPEALRCYLQDLVALREYIGDPANRDATIAATAEVTQIPAEVLESFLLTENDYLRAEGNAVDREGLQSTLDFFTERGALDTSIDLEAHLDPDFLMPDVAG